DLRARLMATFRLEAEEHLHVVAAQLAALDRDPAPAEQASAVEALFRAVHTLKGAARSVTLTSVEAACQRLESLLGAIKKGGPVLARDVLTALQDGVAEVEAHPAAGGATSSPTPALATAAAPPPPEAVQAPPVAPAPPPQAGTIRVTTLALDDLQTRSED